MYFQIKVNKSGKCCNLKPRWMLWWNFHSNCSSWGFFFMLFPYFIYITHFTKFTHGSSLLMERSLQYNLLVWCKLSANLYEQKSRIWFWEKYNHFEWFYRVYRFNRFSPNFAKSRGKSLWSLAHIIATFYGLLIQTLRVYL